MQFDKEDYWFIGIMVFALMCIVYANTKSNEKIEKMLTESGNYNFTVVVRQARIEQRLDTISVRLDSIRRLYLHK